MEGILLLLFILLKSKPLWIGLFEVFYLSNKAVKIDLLKRFVQISFFEFAYGHGRLLLFYERMQQH